MKPVLAWVKSNVVVVISITVCVACLIMLVLIASKGGAFIKQLESEERVITQLQQKRQAQVELPPRRIDGAPVVESQLAINRNLIGQLESVYSQLAEDYDTLYASSVVFNENQRPPMMTQIFPDFGTSPWLMWDVRGHYRDAFEEMFQPYQRDGKYARLDAGMPLAPFEIETELQRVEDEFARDLFPKSLNDIDLQDRLRLWNKKQTRKLERMREHASTFHIYADSRPTSAGYPLTPGSLAEGAGVARLDQAWLGQMRLWIHDDIVRAIGRANRVDDRTYNVTRSPVKRLLKLDVAEGYVGATGGGALGAGGSRSNNNSAGGALPMDFSMSPTGRRSNGMYDVWHVTLDVHIDLAQLTTFVNALSETNFMTVLNVQLSDLDEYELLREGYFYGQGDMVRAQIVVETLWFRDWTVGMMPNDIKIDLGLVKGIRSTARQPVEGASGGGEGGRAAEMGMYQDETGVMRRPGQ